MISKKHTPPVINASLVVYRRLLAAYPPAFRQEYGDQMVQLFSDCCMRAYRQNGSAGMIRMWAATLVDLVKSLIDEHLQKETDMSRSTFIRISGWALILGALAFSSLLLTLYMDDQHPALYWGPTFGAATYIAGFWVAPFLVGIGLIGLQVRYGQAISSAGKAILVFGTLLGLGLTSLGILSEAFSIFGLYREMFTVWAPAVLMLCLTVFGVIALVRKPLPRWNGLPFLAGAVLPATLIYGYSFGQIGGFNWLFGGLALLVQMLAMIALGFILQSDVPQQEVLAAA